MIIDAHQHFWTLSRGDYPWPNETVAPIFRDFGPDDLSPLLAAAGVDRTVLVQATDSVAETEFMFSIAETFDRVAGVVGWVDLSAPGATSEIDRLRKNPILKGLRPMLQGIDDTNWILQDAAQPALQHMQRTRLCFDALIQPRHLSVLEELARRYPDMPIVIDHAAKPAMGHRQSPDPDWAGGMERLAALDNVHCKLSGLKTEIGPNWHREDILPFAQLILDQFGAQKTLFGSDWPVINLASNYASWIGFVRDLISPLSSADQARIMGGNAQQFYGLPGGDND